MPVIQLVTTKSTGFQGESEEWSNAYHYEVPDVESTQALETLADDVIDAERYTHSTRVLFLRAQVFDIGTPPNYMRFTKDYDLDGLFGSGSNSEDMYPELAILITWELPRRFSSTPPFVSTRRRLQKWLHTCETMGLNGRTRNTAVNPAPSAYATKVSQPNPDSTLVAPNGDIPESGFQVYPYLEHRQFHRGT